MYYSVIVAYAPTGKHVLLETTRTSIDALWDLSPFLGVQMSMNVQKTSGRLSLDKIFIDRQISSSTKTLDAHRPFLKASLAQKRNLQCSKQDLTIFSEKQSSA